MDVSNLLGSPRALGRVTETPSWWRRLDLALVGSALALAFAGVLMVLSATRNVNGMENYTALALRQGIWVLVGLGLMSVVAWFDYRRLRPLLPWIYGGCVGALLIVLTPLGSESKGAQAWFQLGGFQFQPSELSKIALILVLAAFFSRQIRGLSSRHVAVGVGIAGIPVALILLQPDLGTVLVFAAIALLVLLVAGAPAKALLALGGLAVVGVVAVVQLGILQQYQLDRLGVFLDPSSNTQESAYNLNQSKIAIGSGQIVGKGLFLGTQTNLRYVPEQHTDFIFTVVGEELGLLGGATMLAMFSVLVWRIWATAKEASTPFGSLICVGVLAMIVFQVFQNVGMAMGIMPITGIPLPLVSYGGSSMLACFIALGLVLSVRLRS
jgi:rod shape determining protein RodA